MPATTLANRAVLRLSGEDVRGFLQSLVTNDVTGALPVWAGLLSAQGKCLFDFLVWADGEDLLIDCEAEAADELAKRLRMYRLRRPIEIERDDGLAVHWSPHGDAGVPDPRLPALGRRWIGAPGETSRGWLAHRLSLGVTEGRAELGDHLWLECNAAELNGVSFTKGCYVGQENTARMNWRQKVNRRLVVVPYPVGFCGGIRDDFDGSATKTKPAKADYPDLGYRVEHRRVDDLAGLSLPDWLAAAL